MSIPPGKADPGGNCFLGVIKNLHAEAFLPLFTRERAWYNAFAMKKLMTVLLALTLLLSVSACGKRAAKEVTPTPEATAAPATSAPATPAPTPTPIPAIEPVSAESEWSARYGAFLERNFDALAADCYGYIAGVGFIDLDLDTVPELLLFDAGASSSMGVQLFDLVGDGVELISASSVEVGTDFGGAYFVSDLFVDTNEFRSFRLAEAADGSLGFRVISRNGADDMRYCELLRFRSREGVLVPETIACAQTAIDPATQSELYTVYTAGDAVIDAARYEELMAENDAAADLGYEAAGVFIWESPTYGQDLPGFSAMLRDAAALYVPAV